MPGLNMGYRKVQLIRGTFFISLPGIWARNYNIHRGTEVKIFLKDDGSLEISHNKAERDENDSL